MTLVGSVDSAAELECLVEELLAKVEPLGNRERSGKFSFSLVLLLVDPRPLSLVARAQERAFSWLSSHPANLRPY